MAESHDGAEALGGRGRRPPSLRLPPVQVGVIDGASDATLEYAMRPPPRVEPLSHWGANNSIENNTNGPEAFVISRCH